MVPLSQDREVIYESKGLDHLGLVAGMYEEMGIGGVVNSALGEHPEEV